MALKIFTFLFDNLQIAPELVTLPLDFENDNVFFLFSNLVELRLAV